MPRRFHTAPRFASAVCALACAASAQSPAPDAPRTVARLEDPRITESSGVAASRVNREVYWTHNDSGAGPVLYAFDLAGRARGRWRVPRARAADWEDIAVGPGPRRGRWYVYIGDIGDNLLRRREVVVYRAREPCLAGCGAAPHPASGAEAIRLRYPDGPHNAEALLVHPSTGGLYIVTKAGNSDPGTAVYKAPAPLAPGKAVTMERIATLQVPAAWFTMLVGGITGGDISPGGNRVVLCDYFRAYEAALPAGAQFDAIWRQTFTEIPLGLSLQVEGICYRADGKAIIATSEGTPCRVIELPAPAASPSSAKDARRLRCRAFSARGVLGRHDEAAQLPAAGVQGRGKFRVPGGHGILPTLMYEHYLTLVFGHFDFGHTLLSHPGEPMWYTKPERTDLIVQPIEG